MKQLFKLFGIIVVAAMIIFTMSACDNGGDDKPTNRELADEFALEHDAILEKTTETVAISDEAAVDAALAAYNELSAEVKALLAEEKTLLDNLKAKITELKATSTLNELVNTFKTTHAAILAKTVATVTVSDVVAINTALAAYEALSAEVKALLTAEKTLLDSLKAKFTLSEFTIDLSTLPAVKNATPFTINYDDFLIPFPQYDVDFTQFTRLTVKAKYFDASNIELPQRNGMAMVVLVYDPTGDLRGPATEPGPNTPFKEFNIGGISGIVDKEQGAPLSLTQAPGAILFQNSRTDVKYIEVTEIKFHNSTVPVYEIPPFEEWPIESRWNKGIESTKTTLDYSVASDGVVTITVGGDIESDKWRANVSYQFTAETNKSYVYKFQAWTAGGEGDREFNIQYYWNDDTQHWKGKTDLIMNETPKEFIIIGEAIPAGGHRVLQFDFANQTGTLYVKMLEIREATAEELFHSTWNFWLQNDSGSASYSFSDDYVITATTVNGSDLLYADHSYNANANTSYTYSFEAWTDSGDYTMPYRVTATDINDYQTINIGPAKQTYTFTTPIITQNERIEVKFHFENTPGTYHLKLLSITPN